MKPLKRVVIKEELVALTGDYKEAIILNQFVYWSMRVADFDKFIKEEKKRCTNNGLENNQEFTNGWIYKSAKELSEETMLGLSKSNMGKYIKNIVDKGWLYERRNPLYKWDRTKQYRVNISKLQIDLYELGYSLDGYPLLVNDDASITPSSEIKIANFKTEHAEKTANSILVLASSNIEHGNSKTELESHETELYNTQNRTAIPEITSEITSEITYNQSVNNNNIYIDKNNDSQNKDQEEIMLKKAYEYIQMNYKNDNEQLIFNSFVDIITADKNIMNHDKTTRKKYVDKLLDKKLIDSALNIFKVSMQIRTINKPQNYFTSILYNVLLENKKTQKISKNNTNFNRFHNFNQRTNEYTAEQLKEIGKRNFKKKLKEIGIALPVN